VLLEGPAVAEKRKLAYAVAERQEPLSNACNVTKASMKRRPSASFDEALQRLRSNSKSKSDGIDLGVPATELHGQQFFSAGPLLQCIAV